MYNVKGFTVHSYPCIQCTQSFPPCGPSHAGSSLKPEFLLFSWLKKTKQNPKQTSKKPLYPTRVRKNMSYLSESSIILLNVMNDLFIFLPMT